MGFFNIWTKGQNANGGNGNMGASHTNGNGHSAKPSSGEDIAEEIFTEKEKPKESPKADAIHNNIQELFSFLDRNYEQRGYDDALINPDSSHLDQNLLALKNELSRTINKVKTFYEDSIREIEFHIDSRSRSGMVDTVEELKMKKTTAQSHIEKINEIESDAINDRGDSQGILISYTRGFKNGLAAISHHAVLSRKF